MSLEIMPGDPSENEKLPPTGARGGGIRTHVLLVLTMSLVIITVSTVLSFLIRHRLEEQANSDLSQDLTQSVVSFKNLEADRRAMIDRENTLLAELPPVKALMTSGDDLTVQNGGTAFWQLSGDDLFALADSNGRIVAAYTKEQNPDSNLKQSLQTLLQSPKKHYLLHNSTLYVCSFRPIRFGDRESGTLLGYVFGGAAINRGMQQVRETTAVDVAFLSEDRVVASTMAPQIFSDSVRQVTHANSSSSPLMLKLGDTRYLAATEDLSALATSPIQLLVLKSFAPAEQRILRTNRAIWNAGWIALLVGSILMLTLSRILTRPLELLSHSVRAFGEGDTSHAVPQKGTQELRELSAAFVAMRAEIQQADRALLESERLATIGSMASSVSHDLRHYLAAVFANAEFLASEDLPAAERAEIFADIRTAVNGITDMIESLLIFSRTGSSVKKSIDSVLLPVERAFTIVRAHPDAEKVKINMVVDHDEDWSALIDCKQIERAVYNLLLNGCQAAYSSTHKAEVSLVLGIKDETILIDVIDNGLGVPESIRESLFDPFVSEGKQKGSGLGLTLAHCIAAEHGGAVVLMKSRQGETIFQMSLARNLEMQSDDSPRTVQGVHAD